MKKGLLSLILIFTWILSYAQIPVLLIDAIPGSVGFNTYTHINNGRGFNLYSNQAVLVTEDAFYFYTSEPGKDIKFWKSTGTAEGTEAIFSYPQSNSAIDSLARFHDIPANATSEAIFFIGYDATHGEELWKLERSTGKISMVKDLIAGPGGSLIKDFIVLNNELYFFMIDYNNHYAPSLWKSNGTAAGTVMLKQFEWTMPDGFHQPITSNGLLYFIADDGVDSFEVWRSDGTTTGTYKLKNISNSYYIHPDFLTSYNNKVYFSQGSSYGKAILWESDGTTEGTKEFVVNGIPRQYTSKIQSVMNRLIFIAMDTAYVSDGTAPGTGIFNHIGFIRSLAEFKGKLFFTGMSDDKIWISNLNLNDTSTTQLTGKLGGNLLLSTDSLLYFGGMELGRTDGSEAGTFHFDDINPGTAPSFPHNMFIFNRNIYFIANDGIHGYELYTLAKTTNAISGVVFNDANENGIQDPLEKGISNQSILLLPDSIYTYTTNEGIYNFTPPPGNYTVKILPSEYWRLASTPETYSITVPHANSVKPSFGLVPTIEEHQLTLSLTGNRSRCGFEVGYWLSLNNTGNVLNNGTASIKLDPAVTFITANPAPDIQQGDSLLWNYHELMPGQRKLIYLKLGMPGVDAMRNTIRLSGKATISGTTIIASDTLEQIITCAYDPNDKLVKPAGIEEAHYTLKNSWLDYTIRFQNTGNDTAFTVLLRDTLDINLDLSTFEIISSSHNMQASRKDKALAFQFDNILLPDSTTNEPLSHGYVRYRIKAKAGVAENTVVENKAHIFFDFNPAIETNTTFNTLVTTLPQRVVSGLNNEKLKLKIQPNPTDGLLKIRAPYPIDEIKIISAMGQMMLRQNFKNAKTEQAISLENLPAGIYLLSVRAGNKFLLERVIKH